jgi:two-component system, NarL family, invasion response regulator UvrY
VADLLTARECKVLQLLLAEKTTEDIAVLLGHSPKTMANKRFLIK